MNLTNVPNLNQKEGKHIHKAESGNPEATDIVELVLRNAEAMGDIMRYPQVQNHDLKNTIFTDIMTLTQCLSSVITIIKHPETPTKL